MASNGPEGVIKPGFGHSSQFGKVWKKGLKSH
jgi:hypothetical protein